MSNNTNKNTIALSFDVEDWFSVRNMREFINESQWGQQELRVRIGLDFILNELAKKNIKGTFFILGWIADKCPELVRDIDRAGHEIGSHGHSHTPIDLLEPTSFETDLRKSLDILQNITGEKVQGFRAPSFSVTKKTLWSLDIMRRCGLEYDSSIFSTIHPDYGIPNFPTTICDIGGLVEVPLGKANFFGAKIPVSGGGYFRLLPYSVISESLRTTLKEESIVMYFHPWEFDPDQPRVNLPMLKKFRHYVGLNSNKLKFIKLLDSFDFTTIADLIARQRLNGPLPFHALE